MTHDLLCTSIRTFAFLLLFLLANTLAGQSKPQGKETPSVPQTAVTVNGKPVFTVAGVLSFPADASAPAISRRIQELLKDVLFKAESLSVADSESNNRHHGG